MIYTILAFIFVFGLLVTVHEYGHMFFAKRAGIMCPEFAIGMGPKIFSYKKNETLYTIRLLPVGGYVRMAGDGLEQNPLSPGMHIAIKLNDDNEITHVIMDDQHKFQQIEHLEVKDSDFDDEIYIEGITSSDDERHRFKISREAFFVQNGDLIQIAPKDRQLMSKKPYQRFLTLFAGPLFNFILALVIFIGLAYWSGVPTNKPVVGDLEQGGAAQTAGLKKGDEIISVDGKKLNKFTDLQPILKEKKSNPVEFKVNRNGKEKTATVKAKKTKMQVSKNKYETRYMVGVVQSKEHTLFGPLAYGTEQTIAAGKVIFQAVLSLIGSIFTGSFSFDMLNGPVGIYSNVDTVVKEGFITLMSFTALLSVNLGIMNLLPVPALDGGRILFVIYEMIFRKPINKNAERVMLSIGAVFLIFVMIMVTWNDIQRYFM
ncbi:RIP metalloprotease RseP [Mammaliicoccus stepanovicii]|uniref:Zinc metalloprotease n=1 Tax=Mammaliicoccus stepanovicii TaxID=643214 RepID=A0A239ZHQ9_9STAP|nr:RIP metalloprotease RseP [Mammaliicoccus stepanovicii]PNZ78007.1 RIP metalloprotease RseP [Mammaliicoccus stepanovicii]GGI41807.1 zinc metalloprotease [Mammaliicoccus stepanovicii]SNV70390.1 protease [Mammaliicoccus stepanovicii]